MSIPQYLKSKYGFAGNAEVPVEFLCDELLIDERGLKQLLPKKQREWMRFSVFCVIIEEVLQGG